VNLEAAIQAFRRGRLVMLYDGDDREAEVDFIIRADAVTPQLVRWLRKNAGGCSASQPREK
jgi:3,4-dihydroxy 2-butanone 4-phosphate synthase